MTFKAKIENIWYHYKWPILITLFIIIAIVTMTMDYFFKEKHDFSIGYIGERYADDTFFSPVKEDISKIVGDINGDGKVSVNYEISVYTPPSIFTYDLTVANQSDIGVSFFAGDVRVYIAEKKFIIENSLFLKPLEDILPDDKLNGAIVREVNTEDPEYVPKDSDGKAIAVPITNFEKLSSLGFMNTENLYIALREHTYTDDKKENIEIIEQKALEVFEYLTK